MDTIFDHDRLDVYRLVIEYTAESFALAKDQSGIPRDADADGDEGRCSLGVQAWYHVDIDYEHEHRCAEHEHAKGAPILADDERSDNST